MATIYQCQWTGCPYEAVSKIRRGEQMDMMFVCVSHSRQFHELQNPEAKEVGELRGPVVKRRKPDKGSTHISYKIDHILKDDKVRARLY